MGQHDQPHNGQIAEVRGQAGFDLPLWHRENSSAKCLRSVRADIQGESDKCRGKRRHDNAHGRQTKENNEQLYQQKYRRLSENRSVYWLFICLSDDLPLRLPPLHCLKYMKIGYF
nr:MAG TPA: hypothetical protein [Bacteriophage sp.]